MFQYFVKTIKNNYLIIYNYKDIFKTYLINILFVFIFIIIY